jgi:hypothetical protein
MICKDCKPRWSGDQGTYVELCSRHAGMAVRESTVEALVHEVEGEQKERRRYALLQAAATIYGAMLDTRVYPAEKYDGERYQDYATWQPVLPAADDGSIQQAVSAANGLLSEIEAREKREKGEG